MMLEAASATSVSNKNYDCHNYLGITMLRDVKGCKSCLNIQCVISASQAAQNGTALEKQGTNSSKLMKCQAAQRSRTILKVQQR